MENLERWIAVVSRKIRRGQWKLFILFSMILVIIPEASGQYRQHRSIIYYNDGSVFIGEILGASQYTLRVWITTGDTITIQQHQVKRLFGADDVMVFENGKFHYVSKYFAFFYSEFALGYEEAVQAGLVAGYRLDKRVAVGAGMGLESYEAYLSGLYLWHEFYSLFGYGRYFLNDNRRRLFADARLGYGFAFAEAFSDPHSGGILFQPGIGVLFSSKHKFRMFAGLSHCTQYTRGEIVEFDAFNNPIRASYELWYQRVFLKIGLEFH